jgi:hypothetical protein
MPYSKLLMKVVAESGKTSKEIIDECNKRGRNIDKAYMSKLLNDKVPPPSEEISRMIADICEFDEKKLVLEGYIDKAPKEIYEAFVSIKLLTTAAALDIFLNPKNEQTLEELEREMNKEPVADFIIDLIKTLSNNINLKENGFDIKLEQKDSQDNLVLSLREPIGLPIKDNAMFPIIPLNSKISLQLQKEYNNGDILAIKVKEQEDFIVRYALFNGNEIILTALNREFKPLTYKKEDIIIFGKVVRVITDI